MVFIRLYLLAGAGLGNFGVSRGMKVINMLHLWKENTMIHSLKKTCISSKVQSQHFFSGLGFCFFFSLYGKFIVSVLVSCVLCPFLDDR